MNTDTIAVLPEGEEPTITETEPLRKLASIRKIEDVFPIEGADMIEAVRIGGWIVVVKKADNFKIGDLCVYCEIDSILPDRPEFEFLRDVKWRIKTRKMQKCVSQGIVFPLNIILNLREEKAKNAGDLNFKSYYHPNEGDDVTLELGVTKYESPDENEPGNITKRKGNFPSFIYKTNEERLQNLSYILEKYKGITFYISEKIDGCLDENTIIFTEDGNKSIKEICEKKYSGKTLVLDENGKQDWAKITNHLIREQNDNWYEIELENGLLLKLTGNHRVYIPNLKCYRKVKNLDGSEYLLLSEKVDE